MKDWETIAENLKKAGWSLGWVSAVDGQGRTIWIVDGHGYGKRFIVRADEKLTAFSELESECHRLYDVDMDAVIPRRQSLEGIVRFLRSQHRTSAW